MVIIKNHQISNAHMIHVKIFKPDHTVGAFHHLSRPTTKIANKEFPLWIISESFDTQDNRSEYQVPHMPFELLGIFFQFLGHLCLYLDVTFLQAVAQIKSYKNNREG